jgi:hypothetical protein
MENSHDRSDSVASMLDLCFVRDTFRIDFIRVDRVWKTQIIVNFYYNPSVNRTEQEQRGKRIP